MSNIGQLYIKRINHT